MTTRPPRVAAVADHDTLASRPRSIAVCVPVYNEAAGIERTLDHLVPLLERDLVDQLLVLDGGSTDATPDIVARRLAGLSRADAVDVAQLAAGAGPVRGKGDSMWRACEVIDADVTVFVDADLLNVSASLPLSLAAPLVFGDEVDVTKGLFHRISDRGDPREYDGGRVTELVARPLINLIAPQLAHFYQPLGGQVGIRTQLLASLPVFTGYGVEIGMLFDLVERVGLARIGEVELGDLVNSEKDDGQLLPMAQQVAYTLMRRTGAVAPGWVPARRPAFNGDVDIIDGSTVVERPPWNEWVRTGVAVVS